MNIRQLLHAFDQWREDGNDLVLATVYDTAGSTYSKIGAQMLIDGDGNFQGMLSGGCLEGDLAERAAAVVATGDAQSVTYDLGSKDEELWGLGVGCDGLMRIFLQPLRAADGYQPFAAMAGVYAGDAAGASATVIESANAALPRGAAVVCVGDEHTACSVPEQAVPALQAQARRIIADNTDRNVRVCIDGVDVELLCARLSPPPRVLVLGGGLDAQPVVRMITELGWRACVQDHRPAYLEKGDFRSAEQVTNLPADAIGDALDFNRFDAVVVMSHHLQTDRCYLQTLANTGIGYIGLLGPIDRRRRLLEDLGDLAGRLEGRLYGPAGVDIGGRGPAAIALSIVAQMHQKLLAKPAAPDCRAGRLR